MLVFLIFLVRYLTLFCLFSVKDCFKWFWTESVCKNIQLMLVFIKALFLVLHFSYYALMTFLMSLSVILLSRLMILFFTLSVIRHLICGNKLELAYGLESNLQDTGLGQEVAFWFQCWKSSTCFFFYNMHITWFSNCKTYNYWNQKYHHLCKTNTS